MEAVKIVLLTLRAELTVEQSTLNHQSQMKYCWLNRVPLGQRRLYLVNSSSRARLAHTWKA